MTKKQMELRKELAKSVMNKIEETDNGLGNLE